VASFMLLVFLCTLHTERCRRASWDWPLPQRRSSEWRGMAPCSPKDGTTFVIFDEGSRTRTAWRQCRPSFVCGNRQDFDTCRPCAGRRRGIKGRKGIKGRNDFGASLNRPRPALQVSRAKLGMSWSPISLSPKGSFRTFCLLPGIS
jgi:hypothetical protein